MLYIYVNAHIYIYINMFFAGFVNTYTEIVVTLWRPSASTWPPAKGIPPPQACLWRAPSNQPGQNRPSPRQNRQANILQ